MVLLKEPIWDLKRKTKSLNKKRGKIMSTAFRTVNPNQHLLPQANNNATKTEPRIAGVPPTGGLPNNTPVTRECCCNADTVKKIALIAVATIAILAVIAVITLSALSGAGVLSFGAIPVVGAAFAGKFGALILTCITAVGITLAAVSIRKLVTDAEEAKYKAYLAERSAAL